MTVTVGDHVRLKGIPGDATMLVIDIIDKKAVCVNSTVFKWFWIDDLMPAEAPRRLGDFR